MGYDCGGHGLNITSLSLLDIGDCNLEDIEPITENTHVQLLQLSDFDKTRVIQCKIEIDRIIYYCGMHSHVSIVHGGRRVYLQETAASNCRRIHETGAIDLGGRDGYITGLKPNSSSTRSITLAGHTSVDGRCSGAQYSDPYGTWDSVVVQATIRVTLRGGTSRRPFAVTHMRLSYLPAYTVRSRPESVSTPMETRPFGR